MDAQPHRPPGGDHPETSGRDVAPPPEGVGAATTRGAAVGGSWLGYLVAILILTVAYYLWPDATARTALYTGAGLALVVALAVGIRRNRPRRPIHWYVLLAGAGLLAVADAVWFPFSVVQQTLPYPSAVDGLYLVTYGFFLAGLGLVVRDRTRGGDFTALIDAVVVATGVGALSWVLLMAPSALNPDLSLLARVVAVAYPAMDILLLGTASALALSRGTRHTSLWLLVAFGLFELLGDGYYTLESIRGTFSITSLAFAGYLLAYACLGAAALHPSMRLLDEPASERQVGRSRLLLLGAVALIAPGVGIVSEATETLGSSSPRHQMVLFAISGLLYLLVLFRASWVEGRLTAARNRAIAASLEQERSEARFHSFVKHSSDLTLACNREGVYTYVSPASERILGVGHASLTGRKAGELVHPEDRADVAERVARLLEEGGESETLTCRVRHSDGSFRRVEMTVTNLLDDAAVAGLVLNVRDVTERHRLETELRGPPSSDEKVPADLNQAVMNTLVVADNAVKYVADVVTELSDLPPVWCHLGDVNQVLLNLIVNAAHAIGEAVGDSGKRGVLTVRTACRDDDVVIEVEDTGVGVAPEIADRLFEPFFTTKEVGKGTGQGLSLAYSLIHDRHGGSISFRSQPGAGATFLVRIPVGTSGSPLSDGGSPP